MNTIEGHLSTISSAGQTLYSPSKGNWGDFVVYEYLFCFVSGFTQEPACCCGFLLIFEALLKVCAANLACVEQIWSLDSGHIWTRLDTLPCPPLELEAAQAPQPSPGFAVERGEVP